MALPSKPSCACCCFSPSEPLTKVHWSRLESQLRENQLPSDIEKQTITKFDRDIEGYDLEIARLQSIIASLQLKRSLAKDYVSRRKSLLAPIRRLPNEVLLEIFRFSSSTTRMSDDVVNLPQLDLNQVCSHWRSVANASPVLWSTFEMRLSPAGSDFSRFSDDAMVNITNMLLTKSMDSSLTIHLIHRGIEGIHPAFQLVLNHSHRWMSATLCLDDLVLAHTVAVSSGFPRLQHLDIMQCETTTLPVAPRLRSLNLDVGAKDVPLGRQDFPWSQLKEVRLFGPASSDCTDIFSWCDQLQYATLISTAESSSDDPIGRPIVSPTIISVTLRGNSCDEVEDFFRLAQISQLRTLELEGCGFPKCYKYPFIAHSPLLTSISFRHLILDVEHVVNLLRLLPLVTDFCWQQDWLYSEASGTAHDFFSKLHPANSRILLPRLKHYDMEILDAGEDLDVAVSAFVEVVQARWVEVEHPHEQLKSVRLSFPNQSFNHDLIQPLNYLPKVGMTISIEDKCGLIL